MTDSTGNSVSAATSAILGTPSPSITSISPSQVVLGQPTTLTVSGANFQSNFTATVSNGTGGTTFVNASQVQVQVTMSGTPPYVSTLTITNPNSGGSATGTFQVVASPIPLITTSSLPTATPNSSYNTTLAATGGVTPYTWSVISGTLPPGLALYPTTGLISGTATATGTWSFTVQVADASSQTTTRALSTTVVGCIVEGCNVYPARVEFNLGPLPIDYYPTTSAGPDLPNVRLDGGGPVIPNCNKSVRQCIRDYMTSYKNQGATGLRFQFGLGGGAFSTPFTSQGIVRDDWVSQLAVFFGDAGQLGLKVTPTPNFGFFGGDDAYAVGLDPTAHQQTPDPYKFSKCEARDAQGNQLYEDLFFVPWLPYGLVFDWDYARNAPTRNGAFAFPACGWVNDAYNKAVRPSNFWGWDKVLVMIDKVLGASIGKVTIEELDMQNEIDLVGSTVQGRLIDDWDFTSNPPIEVSPMKRVRQSFLSHNLGAESYRRATFSTTVSDPSVNPSNPDPINADGGECGSVFGDTQMILEESTLTSFFAGGIAGFRAYCADTPKTITFVADNGSGAVRITVPNHHYPDLASIYVADVSGSGGLAEYLAGGYGGSNPGYQVTPLFRAWKITVIDENTFDLLGSTWDSNFAYFSGGNAQQDQTEGMIRSPIDLTQVDQNYPAQQGLPNINDMHFYLCIDDPFNYAPPGAEPVHLCYLPTVDNDLHSNLPSTYGSATARNFYNGVWNFFVNHQLVGNIAMIGETNWNVLMGPATASDPCWVDLKFDSSMAFNNINGFNGYNGISSLLYANAAGSTVLRVWENEMDGCYLMNDSAKNKINPPYNPFAP